MEINLHTLYFLSMLGLRVRDSIIIQPLFKLFNIDHFKIVSIVVRGSFSLVGCQHILALQTRTIEGILVIIYIG